MFEIEISAKTWMVDKHNLYIFTIISGLRGKEVGLFREVACVSILDAGSPCLR